MQENLFNEVKKHFNEPILIGFNLCRCIGYAEDDEDCYMIVLNPHPAIYPPVYWVSLVGGYTYLDCLKQAGVTIPLHPSFPGEIWTDFSRLDTLLELNGAPKEKEFIAQIFDGPSPEEMLRLEEISKYDKIVVNYRRNQK